MLVACGGEKVVQKKEVDTQRNQTLDLDLLKKEGLDHFKRGNNIAALKRLKQFDQKRSNDFDVIFALGKIVQTDGALKDARDYYQRGYILKKNNISLLKEYSALLFQMKAYQKGVDILERGIDQQINPDLGVLLIAGYGYLAESGQNQVALRKKVEEIAQKALKEKPGDGGIYGNLGLFYVKIKAIPLATYIFSIAEKNAPKSPVVFNIIGWFHEQQKRPLMAKYYYQKSLKMQSDYIPALKNMVRLELDALNYLGALPLLKQLETLKPDDERTAYGLALTYLGLRKFDQSIKKFETLHKHKSKKDIYPLILGDIYYKHLSTSEDVIDQPKKQRKYFQLSQKWYRIYYRLHPELKKNGVIMTALTDIKMQLNMSLKDKRASKKKSGQRGKTSQKNTM